MKPTLRFWGSVASAALAVLLFVGPTRAEPASVRVNVAAKPISEALIDLALQTGVSLGGDLRACRGNSSALRGRMPLAAALDRLLAGSPCSFTFRNDRAVMIVRRAASHPPSMPRIGDDRVALTELVITAGRRPDLPGRAPFSISSLSGFELQGAGVTDMHGLAGQAPSITVTNLGPGRDKILVRGFSDGAFTGQTQSTVGLYLDDVPITYNAPDPDLRLIDVERVEVLRGPQGTLYGSGSIGGIVRIVTRLPDLDVRSAEASASVSATRSADLNSELEGMVNLPLLTGRLAVRAAVYGERDGGYINDLALGRSRVNAVTRSGGRLSALAALSQDWTLGLGYVHQSINSTDTQYAVAGFSRQTRSNLVPEPHDNDFDALSATLSGEGGLGRITWSTSLLRHRLDSRYDASSISVSAFGLSGAAAFDEARAIHLTVSELTWAPPERGRWRGLLGVFASTGEAETWFDLSPPIAPASSAYLEHRTDKIIEGALFGEATYRLSDRLSITLGGRLFASELGIRSEVTQPGGFRRFDDDKSFRGLSPKLAVSFRLSDRSQLYAQIADGFRTGGFNTGGLIGQTFAGGVGEPVRRYDIDRLRSYELGLKYHSSNEAVRVRLAAFLGIWTDIQSDQYLPSGLGYTVNVGDGANHGLEWEVAARPTPRLEIRLSGLLADSRLTRRNPAFPAARDDVLPGVPAASGALAVTYQVTLAPGLALRLAGHMKVVGETRLTFDGDPALRSPTFASGRVSATLDHRSWTLETFVDNPFDSHADTFAFGGPFKLGRSLVRTPLRPRTVGITLRQRF